MKTLRATTLLGTAVLATGALLGLAPTAGAANCPPPPKVKNAFAQWGDSGGYVPVTNSWELVNGAMLVADDAPTGLSDVAADGSALFLPAGGSATSACTTAPMITSIVRFYVKNVGDPAGRLHVELLVNKGKDGILDGGTITAGLDWQVSPVLVIPWPKPLKGAVDLRVRLTAIGTGAAFEVDDVFLDPSRGR